MTENWVGRFAPTPSGPLHFGSLIAALGSYLIARQRDGQWLIRIEDLDPPREVTGAAADILNTLEAFGFEWNGEVSYQSQRLSNYQQALIQLKKDNHTYLCSCSRKEIQDRNNGIYDRFCLKKKLTGAGDKAIRAKFSDEHCRFFDQVLGHCDFSKASDSQDFVIKRRDGFFAYQLAVVVDDIQQNVNHVVRGADILDSTPRQNFLYQCFNHAPPRYFHLPLALDETGEKQSKRKLSSAISPEQASPLLCQALRHLGQPIDSEMQFSKPREILYWGVRNFDITKIGKHSIVYEEP